MTTISFTSRPVIGSETITVDNTTGGLPLTASKLYKQVGPAASDIIWAKSAFLSVEAQEIRMNLNPAVTVDATSNGHALAAGSSIVIDGIATLRDARFIRTGGTSGTLRVTYFG